VSRRRPLTTEEVLAKRDAFLAAESGNPMGIHWLSFCDPHKGVGGQFLGVVVVRERGFTSALMFTHRMGLNPGGEVQGSELPSEPRFEKVLKGHFNRLLLREEAIWLSEAVGAVWKERERGE
jgi:hypothetical protein